MHLGVQGELLVPARPLVLRGKLAGVTRSVATDEELFATGESWDAG